MPRERGRIRGVAPHGARRVAGRREQAAWTFALALGAALAAALPSAAATLREVRIGRHAEYTRIVFETDAPVRYRVTRSSAGELRVQLEASASPRRVGSKSEVLREVAVESEGGGSVARLSLQRGEVDVREMVLENPPRIVLDLTPRAAAPTAVVEHAKPRAAASELRRPEPARAPAEAARPRTVARAAPAVPAPVLAPEPAEPVPTPAATIEASPTPKPDAVAPAPELATVRPATEAPAVPAPEVARAPTPAVTPAPTPALVGKDSGETESARQAPLELQLVSPRGVDSADDPAAARLAKAERELERLAGIPPAPRERAAAAPAPEPRAEPEPEPAAAEAAPTAATTALAGAAHTGPAPPPTDGAPAATPGPASDAAPLAALAEPSSAGAPADAAPPAPAPAEDARREKQAQRARAPFRPTAPVAPGPLAFLPSPFDDPLVLAGIGALLGLIAALALVRRRAARADDAFTSPFDAAAGLEPDLLAGAGGARAHGAGRAVFEPVSASPVAPPTAEMGPLFASATVVADDEEASIFDVTAEEAVGEDVDTPSVPAPPAFEPALPALGATALVDTDETEWTEEEMRLIEELERRLAHLETRLEEVVDAKERLERHVAAQTEELRVQRAAIARTQRVLRTVVKPDDVATEPVAKP